MSVDGPAAPATPAAGLTPQPSSSNLRGAALAADATKPVSYLAGSRALDSLAKLIQAIESFFHPSNAGTWSTTLARFLQNVTWEFHKRWLEESKPDCKTPAAWRLTPEIQHEFILIMRTVALLSMFSKDVFSIASSQAALKSLGHMRPDLVMPAILERAYPALETVLETHRTTATLTALSALAGPLISRDIYPAGAKHLVPLLELSLPGLDVNDPTKTVRDRLIVLADAHRCRRAS